MTTKQVYSIVASNYVPGADAFLKDLAPGTELVLVREPTNKFDANAVAVYAGGQKLGYVPKAKNRALALFIDQCEPDPQFNMAFDAVPGTRFVVGKFVRSQTSAFPQVEVLG